MSCIQKISPKMLAHFIKMHTVSNVPAFIWGDPGIGKSEITRQMADLLGYHLEDVRLSQIESIDLRGMPHKGEKSLGGVGEAVVEWAMPDFLKRAKDAREKFGKPTMFFFDEMNSAPTSTQAAAYQLVLDRKIGCFSLHPDDRVFAAGNLENSGAITTEMSTALAGRFSHYQLSVDSDDFLSHAILKGFHPSVITYLENNKDKIHDFDPETQDEKEEKGYASPRNWFHASQNIKSLESMVDESGDEFVNSEFDFKVDKPDTHHLILTSVSGTIGDVVANDFMAYLKAGSGLPSVSSILSGKVKKFSCEGDISREQILSNGCLIELVSLNKKFKEIVQKKDENGNQKFTPSITHTGEEEEFFKDFYSKISNFITFAEKNFRIETFVLSVITKMIKQQNIQPLGSRCTKEAFKAVVEAHSNITSQNLV